MSDSIHRQRPSATDPSYWDERAPLYDSLYDISPLRDEIAERITAQMRQPSLVLDAGCGTGRLAEKIKRKFPNAGMRLVDISASMLEKARTRLRGHDNVVFSHCSFEDIPAQDGTFDVIASAFALHHVPTRRKEAALRRFLRLLKPGGMLVIADEIIFDARLTKTPVMLESAVREYFYPGTPAPSIQLPEEWPEPSEGFILLCKKCGFSGVELDQINPITGVMVAWNGRPKLPAQQ